MIPRDVTACRLLRALEKKILDRLEAGKKNAPRRNPNVTCWRCYKKEHVQRECTSDNPPRRNSNVTCWKCYEKGHVQRESPNDNASRRSPNVVCCTCNKYGLCANTLRLSSTTREPLTETKMPYPL
ncbi:hypothetical protein AVEN_268250-1 [Araneus ventricosus]|uniref:CCHC-type domain-containing protein n=1 Tax=Araneus ventricosus TaxID=182803 RepID=A0A4Y2C1E9_ARAVE|nr:hypothetical protein AVEN_268250-1 [Araneus ventricosus]